MSKIVKSFAVVDERPPVKKTFADIVEEELVNMPVIKKQIFTYRANPYADQTLLLPDKKGYLDELNRIKVEIAQSKAELRSLGRQIDEAIEEKENAAPPMKEPKTKRGAEVAQAEAERLLRETKQNIDIMMKAASEEGKKLAEEAKNNGYLEGFDKGFAQALSEFKAANGPKVSQLENLLEQLSNYREEMIAQNERELVAMVISVARKVIGREIREEPRTIASMLYQELDANRREENLRITISPELMPAEAKVSGEIKKMITETAPSALIYVDEEAEEGTVYVESNKGITDLSVNTQLGNIERILTED